MKQLFNFAFDECFDAAAFFVGQIILVGFKQVTQVRQLSRQVIDLIDARGRLLTQQAGLLARKGDAQLLAELLGGLVLTRHALKGLRIDTHLVPLDLLQRAQG
jgi:hypothetical protein